MNNTNPHNDWDNLFEQLPLDTQPQDEHREQLKARALAAFDNDSKATLRQNQSSGLTRLGQQMINYKAPYWTAAALFVGFLVWILPSNNSAFAIEDLVKNLMQVMTAQYDQILIMEDGSKSETNVFYKSPGLTRMETLDEGKVTSVMISNLTDTKQFILNDADKTAVEMEFRNMSLGKGESFESFRDFLKVARDAELELESLGTKVINGKQAEGFELSNLVPNMNASYEIWVDPATKSLVHLKTVASGFTFITTNYEFNKDLDESLFEMETPKGYTLDKSAPADLSFDLDVTESKFIESLKAYSETMKSLPISFEPSELDECVEAYKRKLPAEKRPEAIMQMSNIQIFGINMSDDAYYAPDDVKIGDEDRPIFWYKAEGATKYRVIFADFSVKESEKPPTVEGAVKLKLHIPDSPLKDLLDSLPDEADEGNSK